MKRHITTVLRECDSSQDMLIAVSNDFIIVKNSRARRGLDVDYMYYFDLDRDRWICSAFQIDGGSLKDGSCAFLRKVYASRRRNRVIFKDYFGEIAVIHVIQGADSKTPFRTTSVWSPPTFSNFITTANHIRAQIDPIS